MQASGAGQPLRASVRATLERSLGRDLGSVRVHDDGAAREATSALHAGAFTHGRDIYLGRGASPTNVRLMAHEATHVLQQRAGRATHPAALFVQRVTAEELVEQYTDWGGLNLQEEALAADLAGRVRRGEYAFVRSVILEVDYFNRDDVGRAMVPALSMRELVDVARDEEGADLLRTLEDEIADFWSNRSEEENRQGALIRALLGDEIAQKHYNRDRIREIQESASSDLEALALMFETDTLTDDGSAAARLDTILLATEHLVIPGLQTGIDFSDEGFRGDQSTGGEGFRDPHAASRNQVGHFLTAVGLQTNPEVVSRDIPMFGSIREMVGAPDGMTDQEVALRLTLGHELHPDPPGAIGLGLPILVEGLLESATPGPEGETEEERDERVGEAMVDETRAQIQRVIDTFRTQFEAATDDDVRAFQEALDALGTGGTLDMDAAEAPLQRIMVGVDQTGKGNSIQDLRLSLVGWRLGQLIGDGSLATGAQVAGWLRTNLGETAPQGD